MDQTWKAVERATRGGWAATVWGAPVRKLSKLNSWAGAAEKRRSITSRQERGPPFPFTVTIPEERQDKHLPDKLRAEFPGILSWAVQGAWAWWERGLGVPGEVKAATEGYRQEMDVLGGFIADCCVVKPAAQATVKDLYNAYLQWCESGGERPMSKRAFSLRLAERAFERVRAAGGTRMWRGIGLLGDE